jgi:hypothetical protein
VLEEVDAGVQFVGVAGAFAAEAVVAEAGHVHGRAILLEELREFDGDAQVQFALRQPEDDAAGAAGVTLRIALTAVTGIDDDDGTGQGARVRGGYGGGPDEGQKDRPESHHGCRPKK